MLRRVWCLVIVMAVVSARVVHQDNGIVSIITELEPERAPVAYLQAVDRPPGRGVQVVDRSPGRTVQGVDRSPGRAVKVVPATPSPPLQEGEFRVRSEKIRVVDPETDFEVVHESAAPVIPEEEENVKPEEKIKRRSEHQPSGSNVKLIYPYIPSDDISHYPTDEEHDLRKLSKENDRRNRVQRQRKRGQYLTQYPKRDNTVRTEKTTKIRNNDEPTKVYKHTIVRPVTEDDEALVGRKYGKAGRYGKYSPSRVQSSNGNVPRPGRVGKYSHRPTGEVLRPTLEVDEIIDDSEIGSGIFLENDPDKKKTKKEYSSRTVVKFPDGYAHGNEERVESSSKYRTGSNTKNNHRIPVSTNSEAQGNKNYDEITSIRKPTTLNDKTDVDQPLQEEGTYISSDITDGVDDGLVDDGGVIYSGGGGYNTGYGGHEDGFDKEKHFEKEKEKQFVEGHKSAHGGKAEKGHHSEEAHAKGQSEKHGHDENKGYSQEKEADKQSHLDKSAHFSEGHKSAEGAKGNDYHKEKGHRKGHKKSGFRTVHHKDEFKKKEEFYDEEHSSGDEKKHGHQEQKHHEQSGGEDKKAHLDSGYHQSKKGHEGGHEKGHGYNQQKGYSKEKGHSGHYGDEQEYGKKSGYKEGEAHGHSEQGGHRGHGYH